MKKFLLIVMVLVIYNPAFTRAEQISNLIMPVSYFVDHVKQLNLLKENLTKYRQASVIGVSGLGKTQVTRMYVHENKDYYEIIWFIDCNLDINEELLKLAKAINAVAKTKLISEEDIFSVKKELLAYLSNKDHWLLVFDNLKINENQKIKEFIDWEHNGHVIFVSQDQDLLTNCHYVWPNSVVAIEMSLPGDYMVCLECVISFRMMLISSARKNRLIVKPYFSATY